MANIKNIQEYGNQLVVMFDDGSKKMAFPTSNGVWLISGATDTPDPGGAVYAWPFSLNLVTSEFGQRNGRLHAGMDFGNGIANISGTSIPAAGAGKVIVANKTNSHGGYGNAVVIDHGGGRHTLYGHMRFTPEGPADVSVNVGQTVVRGQRLGGIGKTGASQGNHLHFETHEGGYRWNASARNPRTTLPAWNAS